MSAKPLEKLSNCATDSEYAEDTVDPRVQVELEHLNTATDDINKLEVDLDEARAEFRRLLCETTVQVDALGKKLGSCVERARPYYEARIRAKEALLETQQAAVRFERANSAHAAAKEMVFLAEEGLKAEGRTFDHAWQDMLNHATMRVNESEIERTLSEAEHRRTSKNQQQAEHIVQKLQQDLKRSIAKSSLVGSLDSQRCPFTHNTVGNQRRGSLPYFEQKALYNQEMEKQKQRVKRLEECVAKAKAKYAEALRNLEQISDEIHKIRSYESILSRTGDPLGVRGNGVGAESPRTMISRQGSEKDERKMESNSSSPSTLDSDSGEEFMKLPNSLKPDESPIFPKVDDSSHNISPYLGLSNLANGVSLREPAKPPKPKPDTEFSSPKKGLTNPFLPLKNPYKPHDSGDGPTNWSAIDLGDSSTSEPSSSPMKPVVNGEPEPMHGGIPYRPLVNPGDDENPGKAALEDITPFRESKVDCGAWVRNSPFRQTQESTEGGEEVWTEVSLNDDPETPTTSSLFKKVSFLNGGYNCGRLRRDSVDDERRSSGEIEKPQQRLPTQSVSAHSTPAKMRGKLDSGLTSWMTRSIVVGDDPLINDGTSGRSMLGSRRQSLDTLLWSKPASERVKGLLNHGMMMLNISSLTERRSSEPRTDKATVCVRPSNNPPSMISASLASALEPTQATQATQGSQPPLPTYQYPKQSKKVPSPLEKSLTYLNAEDDSASDSESLASTEMLTDDQISSLMLDHNINAVCEDVLGTPIAEVLPDYPSKRI